MRKFLLIVPVLFVMAAAPAMAQSGGQKTLGATINVYVFPKEGQNASQQSKDEAFCYDWATKETGVDPFHAQAQAQQASQQAEAAKQHAAHSTQGSGARGAIGGAAAGALIGEIASNDPGKGAAWGAALGGIGNRRRARRESEQQQQQIEQQKQQTHQATAQQIENFKKAFAVCLEAKSYMVKF
ncbi:MAG TPA: hypothetical protein ENK19_08065 [Acidobacteria bacterium]|nr:hypothetical protein [Acidobacteriota bacterium]